MKIGVLSDTHGLLRPEVLSALAGCEAILHGGDINRQEILDELSRLAPVHVVRGNNDKEWAEHIPLSLDFTLAGLRVYMTHKKKDLPADLSAYDLVICGHSHKYEESRRGKALLLNPGSCGPRRFNQDITLAVLEVRDGQIAVSRIDIPHPGKGGKRLAVLFPGIGYHCDKPLLYYSGKLAKAAGYEVLPVPYSGFPDRVRGDAGKMRESFELAYAQAEAMLAGVNWADCRDILFIGKSIGTIVACRYALEKGLSARCVLLTPLAETFQFVRGDAIAFHGTADPWAKTDAISTGCQERGVPLYITEGANHSLETGDVSRDVKTLEETMNRIDAFLSRAAHPGCCPEGRDAVLAEESMNYEEAVRTITPGKYRHFKGNEFD